MKTAHALRRLIIFSSEGDRRPTQRTYSRQDNVDSL
jgi:hypothetical protein